MPFPFPQRLAAAELRSLVIAPLIVESQVFGVLVCARRGDRGLQQRRMRVPEAAERARRAGRHQAQLYGALQQAYDDLRQTQHTVMQQERLRALGQMASGIAHDINNAISPVSLYTESLLEREPNLSERARGYLTTIQRAIEDVAENGGAHARVLSRSASAQLTLERVSINRARSAGDRTDAGALERPAAAARHRGRPADGAWPIDLPEIMGAESEIRDALTNLIFNAVDAMPNGGTLTVRTRSDRSRTAATGC